jgi:hypothetical protein
VRKVILVFFVLLFLPTFAEPVGNPKPLNPIEVIEAMQLDGKQAVIFSADLNIDNGNPYTRNHGERGMFGKLVFGNEEKDVAEYIDRADEIFAEAKRLLIGPLLGYGKTDLTYCEVGKGVQLDLETGKWLKSKGGEAIRVDHWTEYMGGKRRAYILLDVLTLWRKGE